MIKIFKDDYNKNEFYALMGKYFAEPNYKKELPYISNKDNTVWYIDVNKYDEVLAFNSFEEGKKVEFKTTYFEENNIKNLESIIKLQLTHIGNKLVETANSNEGIIRVLKKHGFIEYKKTTNYTFLRKEVG